MKFIFFGTPEFAAMVLEKLIAAGYVPAAIVCNPDELVGRKQVLTPPPVKSWIMEHETWNIPVLQPGKLRNNPEFVKQLKDLKPDLAIIAAYGKILPKEILEIPKIGFINVHGSLLPHYRGASPIQEAILNGEKETGVTIMEVDEEMDHGAIISKSKCQISLPTGDLPKGEKPDTYKTLSKKLAILGAELLIKIIPDYISGRLKPIPQDHSKATYTKIIKKEDGKIDWSKSAEKIERMVRAYYPWPSAWTIWNGKFLKILEAETILQYSDVLKHSTGKVFLTDKNELTIKCGNGILIIKKLQLEGGKILTAKEFLNGHKDFIGSVLG